MTSNSRSLCIMALRRDQRKGHLDDRLGQVEALTKETLPTRRAPRRGVSGQTSGE